MFQPTCVLGISVRCFCNLLQGDVVSGFSLHLDVPARSVQLKEAFRKERRVVPPTDSVKTWNFTPEQMP